MWHRYLHDYILLPVLRLTGFAQSEETFACCVHLAALTLVAGRRMGRRHRFMCPLIRLCRQFCSKVKFLAGRLRNPTVREREEKKRSMRSHEAKRRE